MPNIIDSNSIDKASLIDDYFINYLNFETVYEDDIYNIKRAEDTDYIYYKSMDKNNCNLSLLRLKPTQINKKNYYQINKSFSWVKDQGHGYFLYKYCINNLDRSIISDKYQSRPGSFHIWKKLINDKTINVSYINLYTKVREFLVSKCL